MKNITEILAGLGIEIPEDKAGDLNKQVTENYKTVAEFDRKVNKLEGEIANQKERADLAEETLKGFEGKDFDAITKDRDEWKAKAEQAAKDYEEKEQARIYADSIKEACKDLKFTSNSAKTAFENALTAENLKVKDGALLGFTDYVEKYKETDPGAFVNEADGESAKFTNPQGAQPPKADIHEADLRAAFGLPPVEA